MTEGTDKNKTSPTPEAPGVLKIIQSVLAGALGVQSAKRREEDFASKNPWPYILAGVIFTTLFVLSLILVVQWVLASR